MEESMRMRAPHDEVHWIGFCHCESGEFNVVWFVGD